MAGLGMAILGGALEQVGTGIADRGKALREAKLKELEQEREFQFRSREAGMSEDRADARALTNDERQAAENQKSRDAQAAENDKSRSVQGTTYGTAEDGTSVMIRDGKATPVTGADGKPVKLAGKAGDTPSEVQTAEWLIKQGIASSPTKAWELVRGARTDPEKSRASIYKSWLQVLKPQFGEADAGKIQEEAMKRTQETMDMLDAQDGTDSGTGGPAAAEGPGDVIPAEPEKRVVGKVYKAPNGKVAKWTGQGWQPL